MDSTQNKKVELKLYVNKRKFDDKSKFHIEAQGNFVANSNNTIYLDKSENILLEKRNINSYFDDRSQNNNTIRSEKKSNFQESSKDIIVVEEDDVVEDLKAKKMRFSNRSLDLSQSDFKTINFRQLKEYNEHEVVFDDSLIKDLEAEKKTKLLQEKQKIKCGQRRINFESLTDLNNQLINKLNNNVLKNKKSINTKAKNIIEAKDINGKLSAPQSIPCKSRKSKLSGKNSVKQVIEGSQTCISPVENSAEVDTTIGEKNELGKAIQKKLNSKESKSEFKYSCQKQCNDKVDYVVSNSHTKNSTAELDIEYHITKVVNTAEYQTKSENSEKEVVNKDLRTKVVEETRKSNHNTCNNSFITGFLDFLSQGVTESPALFNYKRSHRRNIEPNVCPSSKLSSLKPSGEKNGPLSNNSPANLTEEKIEIVSVNLEKSNLQFNDENSNDSESSVQSIHSYIQSICSSDDSECISSDTLKESGAQKKSAYEDPGDFLITDVLKQPNNTITNVIDLSDVSSNADEQEEIQCLSENSLEKELVNLNVGNASKISNSVCDVRGRSKKEKTALKSISRSFDAGVTSVKLSKTGSKKNNNSGNRKSVVQSKDCVIFIKSSVNSSIKINSKKTEKPENEIVLETPVSLLFSQQSSEIQLTQSVGSQSSPAHCGNLTLTHTESIDLIEDNSNEENNLTQTNANSTVLQSNDAQIFAQDQNFTATHINDVDSDLNTSNEFLKSFMSVQDLTENESETVVKCKNIAELTKPDQKEKNLKAYTIEGHSSPYFDCSQDLKSKKQEKGNSKKKKGTQKKECKKNKQIFNKGDFVVFENELYGNSWPTIYEIITLTALKRYEPVFENCQMVYKSTLAYLPFMTKQKNSCRTVPVKILNTDNGIITAQLNRLEIDYDYGKSIKASLVKYEKLRESFFNYMLTVVSQALDFNFFQIAFQENNHNIMSKILLIDNVITKAVEKCKNSINWDNIPQPSIDELYHCVCMFPSEEERKEKNCYMCSANNIKSLLLFSGQPYNNLTLKFLKKDVIWIEKEYYFCQMCLQNIILIHKLIHTKYSLYIKCTKKLAPIRGSNNEVLDTKKILISILNDTVWLEELFTEFILNLADVDFLEKLRSS